MSTPAPSTPPSTPKKTPTGSWRHPAMDIVSKTQSENTFTDASFLTTTYNSVALLASFIFVRVLSTNEVVLSLATMLPATVLSYSVYALWGARVLFLWNICLELQKLMRPVDEFTDIPLTPAQRKAMGLKPDTPLTAAAASPEKFATPPRYSKATPASRNASPFPSTTSPTLQRKAALGQGVGMLGMSASTTETPTTPITSPLRISGRPGWGSPSASPKHHSTSSVTPGNRWAYEKNSLNRKGTNIQLSPSKNVF